MIMQMLKRFVMVTSNSTQNRQKKQEAQKDKQKKRLTKESVENADFYKPAMTKIMTTQE